MVTAAQPKIANYHFTTINPNLGVVNIDAENAFVMADIPGLIEGAHQGVGLGHEFLKHIERTKLLIHVVDISGSEGRDPVQDFEVINEELKKYNPVLCERPQIICSKQDGCHGSGRKILKNSGRLSNQEDTKFSLYPRHPTKGLKELIYYAAQKLKELPDTVLVNDQDNEVVYTAVEEEPFNIRKENGVFVVEGSWVQRLVRSVNFDNYESLQYFQKKP